MTNPMRLVVLLLAVVFLSGSSCTRRDPWTGTYSNANGSIVLDVKSGGKASMTLMGDAKECTYTADGDKTLTLACPEPPGQLVFQRQSDESLVGQGFIGQLTKSKR
jgi:hypothetical protein